MQITISRLDGAARAKVESDRVGLGVSPVASVKLPSLLSFRDTNAIPVCQACAASLCCKSRVGKITWSPSYRELPFVVLAIFTIGVRSEFCERE